MVSDLCLRHSFSCLLQSEHVLHVVQTRGLRDHPLSGPQGATRKGVAALHAMRHLDSLAQSPKEDGMVADDVPCPDDLHADLAPLAHADHPLALAPVCGHC